MSWTTKLATQVLGRPRTVGLVVAALTVGAVALCSRVSFDSALEIWFVEDDPDLTAYQAFFDKFRADEIAVVGVFADDVLDPQVLDLLDRVSRKAQQAPHVHAVRSITNTEVLQPTPRGLQPRALLDLERTRSQALTASERRQILDNSLISGTLISADAKAAAVLVELDREGNTVEGKTAMVTALRQMVAAESKTAAGVQWVLSGTPALDETFFRYHNRDMGLVLPAMMLLIMGVAVLVFKRISAALIPTLVVCLAVVWSVAVMGALGWRMTAISSALFALILAVGVADSVHVLADFDRHIKAGLGRSEAALRTTARLFLPCLFTSATTAAGMLSLLGSDLRPVRQFAVVSACGVMVAFVLTVTLVPIVLVRLPRPRRAAPSTGPGSSGRLGRALGQLAYLPAWGRSAVLGVSVLVVVAAFMGIDRLEVGADPMEYFRAGDPFRQDAARIDAALGGGTSLELLVQTSEPDGLSDPVILARLDSFERWLQRQPAVVKVLSVVDQLKELERVRSGKPLAEVRLPRSRVQIERDLQQLRKHEDFASMADLDTGVARISARARLTEASALMEALPRIQEYLDQHVNGNGLRVQPTGYVQLMGRMSTYLVDSQVKSFALAFVVISVLMLALLRSVSLGLLAMVPNLVPVLAGLGAMGWAGIGLDTGTVMIACIALGLVVDDTVHFLVALRRHLAAGRSVRGATEGALQDAGRAIVVTSVLLSASFLTMTLASFNPNIHFGVISGLVIIFALLADLVLLPCITAVLAERGLLFSAESCNP